MPVTGISTPVSVPAIGAAIIAPQDDRLPLHNELEELHENRNRRQESNSEQESESNFPRKDRTDFNYQLREAIHKVRTGPDEIEECILDGSTPFVHSIMVTLIPSKFKVLPLD